MKAESIRYQEKGQEITKIVLTVSGVDVDTADRVNDFFSRELGSASEHAEKKTDEVMQFGQELRKTRYQGGHSIRSTGHPGREDYEMIIKIIPDSGGFAALEDFVDSHNIEMGEHMEKTFTEMRMDYSDYM